MRIEGAATDSRQTAVYLVSYSYPPDSVPAAHRPRELVKYLAESNVKFRLYSRLGVIEDDKVPVAVGAGSMRASGRKSLAKFLAFGFTSVMEIDKAVLWGLRVTPRLWFDLISHVIRYRARPVVWATCPVVTNVYVATLAGILSFAKVNVDLRDAIRGLAGHSMPLLTRIVFWKARTITSVTPSLCSRLGGILPAEPTLAMNGVSNEALEACSNFTRPPGGRIKVAYAGAIYGGDRPYALALTMLRRAAEELALNGWGGIDVTFVGREPLKETEVQATTDAFHLSFNDEVSKAEALVLSNQSDVNLLLVGQSREHRESLPLKVYDLLGLGRPILYVGPRRSDVMELLKKYAKASIFCVDTDSSSSMDDSHQLASWLNEYAKSSSISSANPSARSQIMTIVGLMGVDQSRAGAVQ